MCEIQELMESLGPGAAVKFFDPEWKAFAPDDGKVPCTGWALGDTPIEALTKLRDKVKPRTPEQVAEDAFNRWGLVPKAQLDQTVDEAIIAALRDAGMLREDETYECSCGEQFSTRSEQQHHVELKLHTAVTRGKA